MKKLIALVFGVALFSGLGVSVRADDAADKKAVIATMDIMAKGYAQQDFAKLDSVFHKDIAYGHTTGKLQSKAEVYEDVKARHTEAVVFGDVEVRIMGSVALFRGNEVIQQTGQKSNKRGVLWVLMRGAGPHGWQIVARQNWPLAKDKE